MQWKRIKHGWEERGAEHSALGRYVMSGVLPHRTTIYHPAVGRDDKLKTDWPTIDLRNDVIS